jgi:hypothetical protein
MYNHTQSHQCFSYCSISVHLALYSLALAPHPHNHTQSHVYISNLVKDLISEYYKCSKARSTQHLVVSLLLVYSAASARKDMVAFRVSCCCCSILLPITTHQSHLQHLQQQHSLVACKYAAAAVVSAIGLSVTNTWCWLYMQRNTLASFDYYRYCYCYLLGFLLF